MANSSPSAGQPQTGALQGSQFVELDFTPDNHTLNRAQEDEAIYWSSDYKELSHGALFARAARTRERLIPDLKNTLTKLSTSTTRRVLYNGKSCDLEPPRKRYKLRLTGRVDAPSTNRILMTGWVWIQCSDKYSIWKIKKRLDELKWLDNHEWAPVHLYLEPIVTANAESKLEGDLYDYRTGVSIGDGFELHVDIARTGEDGSLCGRPCRSRITYESRVVNESFCRIGGVLRINDSVDALITTAHGILNYFLITLIPLLEQSDDTRNQPNTSDEIPDDSSDESDMEEFLRQEQQDGIGSESPPKDSLGYLDVSQLQQWEPLKPFDTITYIAQAEQKGTGSMWDLYFGQFDADYALFRQPEWPDSSQGLPSNNLYTIGSGDAKVEFDKRIPMESSQMASMDFKTSYILLGTQEVIPVQLFPDEVEISMHGVKFKTLKLRAPKVLAQGTSGSWVVREEKLCGVIIAIYQLEPYALMLPSAAVSFDLTKLGTSINTVSLPRADSRLPRHDSSSAQQRGTIISAFEPLAGRQEMQTERAGPIYLDDVLALRTSYQSYTPMTPSYQSVGTSMWSVAYGQEEVSRSTFSSEAAQLQGTRISRWLQTPDDPSIVARLAYGPRHTADELEPLHLCHGVKQERMRLDSNTYSSVEVVGGKTSLYT
ncbi:hypothetical protein GQX73_g3795 [Xylaria multiplex]|uniref:Uncharacterized protein n=1 Tax=Xylaria multiplex TaxID=323545 RepID=A0A7C8ITD6_9PEZI|nr:hypothetical protein GQX73_g3795 [Xylaria multiplex]